MTIKRFEDCIAWQKARILLKDLHLIFGNNKDFWYKNQLLDAGLSISNNVAEGFERYHKKEMLQFLRIAKSSCGEVRSMLYVATDLQLCSEECAKDLIEKAEEISKVIQGFIKSLQPTR